MVGILSQYFGDPINCDFKGLDKHMANDYCWIHGSPYIPKGYQHHIMKCIVEVYDDHGEFVKKQQCKKSTRV